MIYSLVPALGPPLSPSKGKRDTPHRPPPPGGLLPAAHPSKPLSLPSESLQTPLKCQCHFLLVFPVFSSFELGARGGGQTMGTEPHRPGPREVHAVRQALPHLVAEEAGADALQVLRGDLQRGHEDGW